ncbi:hypothetical protein [Flavobacterium polysaccharolyticum]|uniref:Secreted protein n=1 Tax=Flavobacterium polysaccharolyticum TaxID=3133148 RepID=A0ABU9NR24_9FLAO
MLPFKYCLEVLKIGLAEAILFSVVLRVASSLTNARNSAFFNCSSLMEVSWGFPTVYDGCVTTAT